MAENAEPASKDDSPAKKATQAPGAPKEPLTLGQLWQAPVLVAGVALFVGGALNAFKHRPKYDLDGALASVAGMIGQQQTEDGLTKLEVEIKPWIDSGKATDEQRRKFHLLRADGLAVKQHDAGGRNAELAEGIVREYEEAERLGEALDTARVTRIAEGLLALNKPQQALPRINTLPGHSAERRRLLRELVQMSLEAGMPTGGERLGQTLDLLSRLSGDASASDEDRSWAYARQAELRLAGGFADDAVKYLLQDLLRLPESERSKAGELYVMLGRAYFETGQLQESARALEKAQAALAQSDPLQAETGLLLGKISLAGSATDEAKERLLSVVNDFADSPAAREARLGLAEAEGIQSNYEGAIERFQKVADSVTGDTGKLTGVRLQTLRRDLESSLRQRCVERLDSGDEPTAMRLAALAERLAVVGGAKEMASPPWVNQALAAASRAAGEKLLAPALLSSGKVNWAALDPVTRAEARRRFADAGARFAAHAEQTVGRDDAAYGRSLWQAADAYDRAGDFDKAIKLFSEFAAGRPGDPKQPEAKFRAAQAHQARGDVKVAADIYRGLIADDPQSGERLRSLVPLAQCLLGDNDPSNDEEAERLLRQAVSGDAMPPDAPDFRRALAALGELYHRSGRLPEAIERLSEYVERYGTADLAPRPNATASAESVNEGRGTLMVRLMLADAMRLSSAEIQKSLGEAMPQTRRQELMRLRDERLRKSLAIYERACAEIVEIDQRRLSELERIAMRNAFFYRADCAFDLGEFDAAIERYDVAANRFSEEPASLVAMIQIVNAYAQQGRWDEARTANERARQRFQELPDGAFNRSDLPMERRHWERWLEASAQLTERGSEREPGR